MAEKSKNKIKIKKIAQKGILDRLKT